MALEILGIRKEKIRVKQESKFDRQVPRKLRLAGGVEGHN